MYLAEAPSVHLTFPPQSSTTTDLYSPSSFSHSEQYVKVRDAELQCANLEMDALFGLFIAITVWVSVDLLNKIWLLARQLYREITKRKPKKYDIEKVSDSFSDISASYGTPMHPITSTPRLARPGRVIISF